MFDSLKSYANINFENGLSHKIDLYTCIRGYHKVSNYQQPEFHVKQFIRPNNRVKDGGTQLTDVFPCQRASYTENTSMSWCIPVASFTDMEEFNPGVDK